jgi:DNA-binding MarR family transcriptional regulator
MDYFWLFVPIWAGLGALLASVALRKLGISRMSYREAKQMLSAIVASLSRRIEQNEALTKELSEQLQILSANQTRVRAEGPAADKERLLEYVEDWMVSTRRVIDRVSILQKNLKKTQDEVQEVRLHVEQLTRPETNGQSQVPQVGIVTEDTLARLTPTEKAVLELLARGPRAAPEIGRFVAKSREHTGRLMKSLFDEGFVERETHRQPYVYRLSDKVRGVLTRTLQHEATRPEL